jgi:hypothetical protein
MTFVGNPAALAFKVAVVGDGNKLEGREKQPFLLSLFEFEKTKVSFPTHIVDELAATLAVNS